MNDNLNYRGPLARIARWCSAHRKTVIASWVVVLIGVSVGSSAVGTNYANNSSSGNTESQRATNLLQRDFPTQAGDTDQIVFKAKSGSVNDPTVRSQIQPMLVKVAKLPHVSGVVSPYSAAGKGQIAPNGQIAFATVNFDQRGFDVAKSDVQRVIDTAESARTPQLQVELGGQAIQQAEQASLGTATAIGLIAAIAVLLITFGSFVAMGLPIATALLGLGTGVGLIAFGTHVVDMPDFSTELAVMIGLGVGIDYALFIVTRFRENFRSGQSVDDAIAGAMDTAGRSVVFAGTTVIIALLGMFALGISFLNGMALAASLAVLATMVASLTALPALLRFSGERVGRLGRRQRRRSSSVSVIESPFWSRWVALIQRRPWTAAIAGLGIMLVLAVPALSMRLGASDAGNNATSTTTRKAYDLVAEGFGKGSNGPLQLVAELPRANDTRALNQISQNVGQTANVASVSPPRISAAGRTAVFDVYPKSAPQDAATTDLVTTLRDNQLPALQDSTGAILLVGGPTANQIDFTNVLASKLPLFIGIVVLLAGLLLMMVFRSVVIPIQAALMNLLSIGASVGVVVAIFQWGWLGGLLGITGGPIDAFIPVFLFAIVFGLSMDYEVFLVSRIHEEWTRRGDASGAVGHGVARTGRVITAAAAIMVCVFASFALGDDRTLKLFGISLATAVFLDAFIVRSLLLPAVLELLGRRTWMLPEWLERRLPHLAIDSELAVEEGSR
ncbi:MAG: putative drug exporter of the superfamily [Solirubrobacterales bacterium]|jgi:RND superfamily putative drug exporter|nr:putative drug exporter of the superfamily [Solirubrobacterales bacterium]